MSTPSPCVSFEHALGDLRRGAVVDAGAGAERDRPLDLRVARRGRDHRGAGQQRKLQRRDRDATPYADDQHRLSRPKRALAEQHAPRRQVPDHQRAGGIEIGIVGQREEAVRGHRDVLGERAVAVLAHDARTHAQGLVAGLAVAALPAERVRIQDRLLPALRPLPAEPARRRRRPRTRASSAACA
jgi:hypothetical protein